MKSKEHNEVSYYDGLGRGCSEKDAWSMHILHFDENGNLEFSCVAGCNGHEANDRIILSMQDELEILRPWAADLPHHFDIVKFICDVDGIRVYLLTKRIWKGHKVGLPHYAIVESGLPRELDRKIDSDLWSIAFSS